MVGRIESDRWVDTYFVKGTRYYHLKLEQDLWRNWVVTRSFGRRGNRGGRVMRECCDSYHEGLIRLESLVEFRQKRRGYVHL